MANRGVISVRYYSGDGKGYYGCQANILYRRSLTYMVRDWWVVGCDVVQRPPFSLALLLFSFFFSDAAERHPILLSLFLSMEIFSSYSSAV